MATTSSTVRMLSRKASGRTRPSLASAPSVAGAKADKPICGMRPFAEMAWEFIRMAVPIVEGVSTGKWEEFKAEKPTSKSELLRLWDEQTSELNKKFPKIPSHRFSEVDKAFGQWEAPGLGTIQYAIDNEIHHRGQGFVYLRALGIEPPPFWERG